MTQLRKQGRRPKTRGRDRSTYNRTCDEKRKGGGRQQEESYSYVGPTLKRTDSNKQANEPRNTKQEADKTTDKTQGNKTPEGEYASEAGDKPTETKTKAGKSGLQRNQTGDTYRQSDGQKAVHTYKGPLRSPFLITPHQDLPVKNTGRSGWRRRKGMGSRGRAEKSTHTLEGPCPTSASEHTTHKTATSTTNKKVDGP